MQDPKTGQLATTKPVRMSFKTDRPFFPYREPEGKPEKANAENKRLDEKGDMPRLWHIDEKGNKQWNDARTLRVFFVSDTRMDGKLGNAAWHARVPWSNELTDEQRKQLVKETGVPDDELPAKAWLTTFEDRASPRPGKEEVYFDPALVRTPIVPPPFIHYNEVWIPIDCVLFVGIFVVLGIIMIAARIMRKKAA